MLVIVAPVTSSRLVALLAAAWTALAACLSFGAIAFTAPAGARLGVLPLDGPHLALAALAGLALAILMTWPLATGLGHLGRTDANDADGQLSIWNVSWVARTLVVGDGLPDVAMGRAAGIAGRAPADWGVF